MSPSNTSTHDPSEPRPAAMPWWGWVVWIATIVYSAIVYRYLPAHMATHFSASGQPNQYSSRFWGVAITPLIMLAMVLLWMVLWRIDPKRRNYTTFWPTYRLVGGGILVLLAVVQVWMLQRDLGSAWASIRIIPTLIGALLVLLANLLPRVQPNWWLGIRTPWTLSSEKVWRKTHRFAGNLGVPMGILAVVLAWVVPISAIQWAILGPILLWALVSTAISYVYARAG